jgi:hypothetical protein
VTTLYLPLPAPPANDNEPELRRVRAQANALRVFIDVASQPGVVIVAPSHARGAR